MITDETVSRIRNGDAIAIVWSVDDVIDATSHFNEETEEYEETLSVEQARKVLQYMLKHHDSKWGITWESVMNAADALFPEWRIPDAV